MKKIILLFLMAVLLQACGLSSVKKAVPNVTSDPTGAGVYANSFKIGTTPLTTNLYKAFPTGWVDWKLSATGVLAIKKSGCEDYTIRVNDAVLGKPIHAKLKCTTNAMVKKPVPVHQQMMPVKKLKKKKISKIEKRLNELGNLHKKGIITEQEYKSTRKRILSEM